MPKREKKRMVNITLNIPDYYENAILVIRKLNLTPSRSEFIRSALREYLREELIFYKDLDNFSEIITEGNNKFVEVIERGFINE